MPDFAFGRALALAALLAAMPAAAQTMYKWVDEKGVTHFSQEPPTDAKAEKKATKVTPKVVPPSGGGSYDPNAWKAKDAEARKRGVERGQQAQAGAKDDAQRAEECERARSRLGMLQTTAPIFRTNPDGSRSYMEDKTREAEIARAKEVEAQACR
jgi:hypothetical protein